jgi:hypothetical protein
VRKGCASTRARLIYREGKKRGDERPAAVRGAMAISAHEAGPSSNEIKERP